jgi:hypothetical protein
MPANIEDIDPTKPVSPVAPPAQSLVVLLGAFDVGLNDKVRSIFNRVVVPVAVAANALIVDDAGISGCAPLIALAAVEQDTVPPVVGIVEHEREGGGIEPNHARVLRLPQGSSLAKYWFQVAAGLVPQAETLDRVAVFLFGGGPAEKKSALWCARRGWPLIVIGKTGGLADDIISATLDPNGTFSTAIDPDLREILETASLFPSSVDAKMDDLTRILIGRVESSAETFAAALGEAWLRYDEIDRSAVSKQVVFRRLQFALSWLAVLAVFLAILSSLQLPAGLLAFVHSLGIPSGTLQILVIVTPITLSIVTAYNSHFRDGNKWILFRGAAEAIKREIYRFRAQAGAYSDEQCGQTSREIKLIAKLTDITSSLEQSEVNKTRLDHPGTPDPNRETNLTPEQYVVARVQDQINYLRSKTRQLNAQLVVLQLAILLAGGAGTFLAAIKLNVWVALATAFAIALTSKLEADQIESSLVQYNQTLATLQNIEGWWKALTLWEKGRRINIDLLVDQTEKAMEAETAGWVQQMQSALEKLTEKESPQGQKSSV